MISTDRAQSFTFTLLVTYLNDEGDTMYNYPYQWTETDMSSPLKVAQHIVDHGLFISETRNQFPISSFILIAPHRIKSVVWESNSSVPASSLPTLPRAH